MLTIGFVGGLRYFDINKKIIDCLANSENYSLLYVGRAHPGCDLQKYCISKHINNAKFMPAYKDEEKPQIYESINIINSLYGDNTLEVQTLLPNRLYDAALYKKPILVSKNTYLQEVVEEYGLGLAIDVGKEDIEAMLEKYLNRFDEGNFLVGCKKLLKAAYDEKREALIAVNKFINAMKHGEG